MSREANQPSERDALGSFTVEPVGTPVADRSELTAEADTLRELIARGAERSEVVAVLERMQELAHRLLDEGRDEEDPAAGATGVAGDAGEMAGATGEAANGNGWAAHRNGVNGSAAAPDAQEAALDELLASWTRELPGDQAAAVREALAPAAEESVADDFSDLIAALGGPAPGDLEPADGFGAFGETAAESAPPEIDIDAVLAAEFGYLGEPQPVGAAATDAAPESETVAMATDFSEADLLAALAGGSPAPATPVPAFAWIEPVAPVEAVSDEAVSDEAVSDEAFPQEDPAAGPVPDATLPQPELLEAAESEEADPVAAAHESSSDLEDMSPEPVSPTVADDPFAALLAAQLDAPAATPAETHGPAAEAEVGSDRSEADDFEAALAALLADAGPAADGDTVTVVDASNVVDASTDAPTADPVVEPEAVVDGARIDWPADELEVSEAPFDAEVPDSLEGLDDLLAPAPQPHVSAADLLGDEYAAKVPVVVPAAEDEATEGGSEDAVDAVADPTVVPDELREDFFARAGKKAKKGGRFRK